MENKRITLIVSSLLCGGVERVVAMMANHWASRNKVTVISFDNGDNTPFFELSPTVEHLRLRQASPGSITGKARRFFSRVQSIRTAAHRTKPDVIISHGEFMNILTGLACAGSPVPLILTEHSVPGNIQLSFGMRLMRNIAYFGARTLVVLNKETADYFARWNRGKIVVIPNPLSPLPSGLSIPPQSERPKTLLGMGRLSHEKGFDRLIRSFALVEDRSWNLVIWGDGPMRRELENLIGALDLDNRVRLPGLTKSPYEELARAAIFVLPSRVEGFGNVLCEAMAAGCAVASFDCPTGPRNIITSGENGVLVPEGEIESLGAALNGLIADSAVRQKLADGGRVAAEQYSIGAVMATWEALLR